jgi:cyclase
MNMALIFNQREDKALRRTLRKGQTETEELLWQELRGSRLGIKFRRQFGVGAYVVDFYAPRVRLVVEIDGSIHELKEIRQKDIKRQKDIEGLGLRFIRFTNDEITGNMEAVLRTIRTSLQNPLLTKERAG